MNNLEHILLTEILPQVEKPSRYLGKELNTVHKDPADVDFRVCLFFPDLYELGLGNLGLHILYAILNDMDGVWAERGYTPAPDLEAALRERDLPLFLYESKDPLRAADCIGFTLQSELTYTNVLNALDLARIPIRSTDRNDDDPIILAGGPTSFNPEPMSPFIDCFIIGDGEDAVVDLVTTLRPLRHASRDEKLDALAALPGCYVPARYPFETLPDGRILPREDAPKIVKRITRDLNTARFPANYIVPFTQLIHDGIGLEVLRGCTQGCRFCQAGMVTRPVRERSLDTIDTLMEESLDNTGLEAVTLVSLSTCDYSRARSLVNQASDRAHTQNVSVSLPSLRLDSFAVELADAVAGVRRSGLTVAPEAATPRLRSVINKFIPDEELIQMAEEAFQRGWTSVKTYFMIGLPTEEDEDVLAIADLCIRTLQAGRAITNRAAIRTGVSTFVPKPFTPFQWAGQIGLEETYRKQKLLAEAFRKHRSIKFGRHAPETSFIEGLLSRADRRSGDLIEAAWRNGAKLESNEEHVHLDYWMQAVEQTGFDVGEQFRERDPEERLPWDHIDILISKAWYQQGWRDAKALQTAKDCRATKCRKCGVIDHEKDLCVTMLKNQRDGIKEEAAAFEHRPEEDSIPLPDAGKGPIQEQPPAVQRIRFRIGRTGDVRLLSHLEWQNVWIRALRRAQAPVAYSQGYHAHPKLNFATAAPLGEESEGSYMDVLFYKTLDPASILAQLQGMLPIGIHAYAAVEMPLKTPSLMSSVTGFRYTLYTQEASKTLSARIEALLGQEAILIERMVKAGKHRGGKKRKKAIQLDLRPLITTLAIADTTDAACAIDFETRMRDNRLAKPKDIMALLDLDPMHTRILKRDTLFGEA